MLTLGIETSCDETAIGIIENHKILTNFVLSQIAHSKFGGVVPELAARNHIKVIIPLLKQAFQVAGRDLKEVDLISVDSGPGLMGALLVGLSFAKSLAIALNIPFIGVNHLEGHIYALLLKRPRPQYPFLVLLVSGGHTEVVLVKKEFMYETLGRTVDDACGEAFDKVAKLMGLPYPGGPYIERLATNGKLKAVRFPIPRPKGYNFSYAGLKTAVLYWTKAHPGYDRSDVAINFQESAIEHLVQVAKRAIEATLPRGLGVVGGVSANKRLRKKFSVLAREKALPLFIPNQEYCTDNGVMIALAGARRFLKFGPSKLSIDAVSRESLDQISI